MLQFRLFGFPVQIQPFFWLACLFFSGELWGDPNRESLIRLLIWTPVMLVSILAHELGHAFAARSFGARPAIALHGMGGLTSMAGGRFTRGQSILVSAAGPAVSLFLGAVFIGLLTGTGRNTGAEFGYFIKIGLFINIVWTIINLLPIQPMDGGQILRDLLGPRRFALTCWIGAVASGILCLAALWVGWYFLAIFAGIMAWMNYQGRVQIPGGVAR